MKNLIYKETGFYRLPEIIGNRKTGQPGLIPISKSTFWQWVKDGRFPAPIKLSPRISVWQAEKVNAVYEKFGAHE